MDDLQKQKSQIDYEAIKAKKVADATAATARQLLADQESERVMREAKEKVAQIQKDAQK